MTQAVSRQQSAATTPAQRWVLALASVASFLVILDMMVVATALTGIRRSLGASLEELGWTVNAYTLSFAVLLMTMAVLGDRIGRRRVFAAGLALFAITSAACALSPDATALIAARAFQGAGAATIMPMALAVLNTAFPPHRRGWAIGIYGSVTGLAALLGPILGGAVTQGLGWQWIFWLNVPIAMVAIPLVLRYVEESFGPGGRVDLPGLVLVSTGAFGLVWGLVRSTAAGWGSAELLGTLSAGAVTTVAFIVWQRSASHPMLPMRLFSYRGFSAGNAAIFFLNASMSGAVFFMPQFLQVAVGRNPLTAGVQLLPLGIAPFLIAPIAGALADRAGERPLALAGLLLQALGMAWIALIAAPDTDYWRLIVPMSAAGVGFALGIPAITRAVTGTAPPSDLGKAAGAYSTVRQLGGAFGVAIISATFAATGSYASPAAFSDGFTAALGAAACIALLGAIGALALPAHPRQQTAATADN
jgi:EmrB/QacA subfamily drug resistance transporter